MTRRAISPNFYVDPEIDSQKIFRDVIKTEGYDLNLDTKINIYYDRVRGWFFDIARILQGEIHAGFVILMICISQIEGIEQFKRGKKTTQGESTELIKNALKNIFSVPSYQEKALDVIVKEVRHGLFHDGLTRKNISISGDYSAPFIFVEEQGIVLINPHLFLDKIEEYFINYVKTLSDPLNKDLREKFEKFWDEQYT